VNTEEWCPAVDDKKESSREVSSRAQICSSSQYTTDSEIQYTNDGKAFTVHGTEIQGAYSNQVIPFLLGSREKSLEIKLDPELSEKNSA